MSDKPKSAGTLHLPDGTQQELPLGAQPTDPAQIEWVMIDDEEDLKPQVICECGSEVAKLPFHSIWCPKYEEYKGS